MSEFFYVLKVGIATVIFIVLMQTRWGGQALETHVVGWIRTSALVVPVRDFADRGAVAVRKVYQETTAFIDSKLKTNTQTADRKSLFNFKRSASVEDKRKNREEAENLETEKSQAGF